MANGILANFGRLSEDRFSRYYCDRCGKEYPALHYSVMKILMKNYRKLSFLSKRGIQMKARNNIIALLP
jgi:hypothetical protein